MQEGLIATHACVMVDVPRLGHADHRMDQQVGLDLLGRSRRQLLVRAVHRVTGLERHYFRPAQLRELRPAIRPASGGVAGSRSA